MCHILRRLRGQLIDQLARLLRGAHLEVDHRPVQVQNEGEERAALLLGHAQRRQVPGPSGRHGHLKALIYFPPAAVREQLLLARGPLLEFRTVEGAGHRRLRRVLRSEAADGQGSTVRGESARGIATF